MPGLPGRAIAGIGCVLMLLGGGCSTTAPVAPHPVRVVAAPVAAAPAAPALSFDVYEIHERIVPPKPDPSGLKPFDEVAADAFAEVGFFTIWRKDDRIWLEVRADQLDQPMLLSVAYASGVGDNHIFPGVLAGGYLVSLHRTANLLQIVAHNQSARAVEDTPLALAIHASFADSLIASAPVASAINAERKSFLVDATALFGSDIPSLSTALESAFRLSYTFDVRNSGFKRVHAAQGGTSLTLRANYMTSRLPPPGVPSQYGASAAPPEVPDARSLLIEITYVLAPLPRQPMQPRLADQRVGYFTTDFNGFGGAALASDRTHYIERWRLEKADPDAALSPPKEPIVVWLDRSIPERWRAAVTSGVLEWNKAFEQAGITGALEVRQQPLDGEWSDLDGTRHIAVQWFAMNGAGGTALSRILTDPRSGEILQASALISDNWTRLERSAIVEYLPGVFGSPEAPAVDAQACRFESGALAMNGFALSLLETRGVVAPDSPEVDHFIEEGIHDVVMHEMGHALGLRHNFRGSASVPVARLRDFDYVRRHGISNSVMDYNPLNVPLEGEPPTPYHQGTLGAYDYWAIEYGYREFAPDREADGLAALGARSGHEPELAYGNDEDAGNGVVPGVDPMINRYDLGDDPLAYYKRSFALARELWRRTAQRPLADGDDYLVNRRNLTRGLSYISLVAPLISKYVGGFYTSRELAGDGRPVVTPVPAEKQREALDVLAGDLFSIDSFRFDPAFMSRIGVDYLGRNPSNDAGGVEFNLAEVLLAIQRGVLDSLMSEATAARLSTAEEMTTDPHALMSLAEVHQRLAAAIWGELNGATHVDSLRRDLQREHMRRVVGTLVRPPPRVAADLRAVLRQVAERLSDQLRRSLANPRLDDITRAHFRESLETVDEALRAPLMKQPG
jgi:hypothetical protein